MSTNDVQKSKSTNCVIVQRGSTTDSPEDTTQLGLCKVKDPTRHGNDVSIDDLPFLQPMQAPGMSSYIPRPAPRGTPGLQRVMVGELGQPGQRFVEAIFPCFQNSGKGMPGNNPLMNTNKDIQDAMNQVENYFPMPDIKETKKRGAVVRDVVEKSKQFSTSLLNGLPINSSLFAMLEQTIPQKKNIETAKEQFNNIIGASGLSGLQSAVGSLGSMFSNMSDKHKKQIKDNIPEDVYTAFESLSFLLPSVSTDSDCLYSASNRVNMPVFVENAVELISQCTSVSDLNECLMRCYHDTTLHGLEDLPDIEIAVEGPFGNYSHRVSPDCTIHYGGRIKQRGTVSNVGNTTLVGSNTVFRKITANSGIEFDGNTKTYWVESVANNNYLYVTEDLPEIEANTCFYILTPEHQTVRRAEQTFGSFMSSSSASGGCPSINSGENLFGDSAKTMFELFQRTFPGAYKEATELMKNTNSTSKAVKRNNIMRVISEGGNPLQTFTDNLGS